MFENVCCARYRRMESHYTGMVLMRLHLTNYYELNFPLPQCLRVQLYFKIDSLKI